MLGERKANSLWRLTAEDKEAKALLDQLALEFRQFVLALFNQFFNHLLRDTLTNVAPQLFQTEDGSFQLPQQRQNHLQRIIHNYTKISLQAGPPPQFCGMVCPGSWVVKGLHRTLRYGSAKKHEAGLSSPKKSRSKSRPISIKTASRG